MSIRCKNRVCGCELWELFRYEQSFRAPRLGNWESRKWYPHDRPRARRGHTKIIADDRGHLLPGVQRLAPWGHFRSTWQLPRRITRKLAKELVSARSERKYKTSWEKRSSHHPLIEQELSTPPLPPPTKEERKHSACKKEIPIVEEKEIQKLEDRKDEHDYTNPVGHDRTPKIIDTAQRCREDIKSYHETCKIHPEKKNTLEKLISSNEEKLTPRSYEDKSDNGSMKAHDERSLKRRDSKDSGRDSLQSIDRNSTKSRDLKYSDNHSVKSKDSGHSCKSNFSYSSKKPVEADFINARYAKELAQNNLKHRPLPDAIEDKLYRTLQMKQVKNPGAELDHVPVVSAVGHKKYVSPGPTQCSKLKVYRPKTAAPANLQDRYQEERPKTGKQKEVNEIDLAICWDLIPPRPEDEPKRPVHIDGSNGSVAPGIFTIVKHPDQETPCDSTPKESKKKNGNGKKKPRAAWSESEKSKPVNPSAVMEIINNNTDDLVDKKVTEHNPHSLLKLRSKGRLTPINGSKENNNPNAASPPGSSKGSKNGGSMKASQNGTFNTSINSEKLDKNSPKARSSPNLSTVGDEKQNKEKLFYARPCMACETKPPNSKHPKEEYKMAFKAGLPNCRSNSNSDSQSSNRTNATKPLNIPKPKTPFAKKSYSINTLAPPFSLWPGTTGMDYPEHWRLASVYQQSYKPIELRKNPMIKGIFR